MPGTTVPQATKDKLIRKYGLGDPRLTGARLKAACKSAAEDAGCHWRSVYRWRGSLLKNGSCRNRRRADAGRSRSLAPFVLRELERLHLAPGSHHITDAELTRQLEAAFPEQPVSYSAVHRERGRLWAKHAEIKPPKHRVEAPYPNYQWQIDASVADVFVQPTRPGALPRRVGLEVVQDEYSRCCPFAIYGARDDTGLFSSLMFNAIQQQSPEWPMCGVPRKLRTDWGKVYVSDFADGFLDAMGIERSQCEAYHPEGKGKVERFIGTIHRVFEQTLPGYCTSDNTGDDAIDPRKDFRQTGDTWVDPRSGEALFTVAELNAMLHGWILGTYHHSKHAGLGRSPAAAWSAAITSELSALPPQDLLFHSLLVPVPGGTRQVRDSTVRFEGLTYWHDALDDFQGMAVRARYSFELLDKVWCFNDEGGFICEAEVVEPLVLGESMDRRQYRDMKRDTSRRRKARTEAIDEVLQQPAAVERLHDRIHDAAENAPPVFVPEPGPWQEEPDPQAEQRERIRQALLSRAVGE